MTVFANASCVVWKKSTRSAGNGACVEIAELPHSYVGVRDSKDCRAGAPILAFTLDEWQAFLRRAKGGCFDI